MDAPGPERRVAEEEPIAAGPFSEWLDGMARALRGEGESNVPCGGCTACCTSSQFVHIEPDEHETLAHIPAALRFPAPGLPPGNVLLGYDERGHCPMLVDDECSIYEHRPRTCRTYDCRIFPATGFEADDAAQGAIAQRARRWRFEFPAPIDRVRIDAVRAAAAAVARDQGPGNATRLAVLSLRRSTQG
jgi:Fe-S-cluster containining protein